MLHGSTKVMVQLHGSLEETEMTISELFDMYYHLSWRRPNGNEVVNLSSKKVRIKYGNKQMCQLGDIERFPVKTESDWVSVTAAGNEDNPLICTKIQIFPVFSFPQQMSTINRHSKDKAIREMSVTDLVRTASGKYCSAIVAPYEWSSDEEKYGFVLSTDKDNMIYANNIQIRTGGIFYHVPKTFPLNLKRKDIPKALKICNNMRRFINSSNNLPDSEFSLQEHYVHLKEDYASIINEKAMLGLSYNRLRLIVDGSSIFNFSTATIGGAPLKYGDMTIYQNINSYYASPDSRVYIPSTVTNAAQFGNAKPGVLSAIALNCANVQDYDIMNEVAFSEYPVIDIYKDLSGEAKSYLEVAFLASIIAKEYLFPRTEYPRIDMDRLLFGKNINEMNFDFGLYAAATINYCRYKDAQSYNTYVYYKHRWESIDLSHFISFEDHLVTPDGLMGMIESSVLTTDPKTAIKEFSDYFINMNYDWKDSPGDEKK